MKYIELPDGRSAILAYDPTDIRSRYEQCPTQKRLGQIQKEAQLNACDPDIIRWVLLEEGCKLSGTSKIIGEWKRLHPTQEECTETAQISAEHTERDNLPAEEEKTANEECSAFGAVPKAVRIPDHVIDYAKDSVTELERICNEIRQDISDMYRRLEEKEHELMDTIEWLKDIGESSECDEY